MEEVEVRITDQANPAPQFIHEVARGGSLREGGCISISILVEDMLMTSTGMQLFLRGGGGVKGFDSARTDFSDQQDRKMYRKRETERLT